MRKILAALVGIAMIASTVTSCKGDEEHHKIQPQPVWSTIKPSHKKKSRKPTPVISCKKMSRDHPGKCLKFG